MIGQIVSALPAHAVEMAPRMRAAEVEEIRASHGLTPEAMLLSEVDRSIVAWSWVVDDQVACMFGIVAPVLLTEKSYPWMLTTDLVDRHWRQFARSCRSLLPELLARHSRLVGMVDARYALSIRWLRWLGATVGEAEPFGVSGSPFCSFEIGG